MLFKPELSFSKNLLSEFVENKINNYSKYRNFDYGVTNRSNVSLLSPYISHKTLLEFDILESILTKYPYKKVDKFIDEIFWRIYWRGWLEMRPKVWDDFVCSLGNIKKNQNYFEAIDGKTNIICFNEWINEIKQYNYLHNHTRMWFASIWIFTLKLPWQLGAEFFLKHLLDGDSASNTLSWRWVAGLQSKGKHYLAQSWNIEKFTNNRFTEIKLNESASPITENEVYKLNDLNLDNKKSSNKFLLIFDNCLSEKNIEKVKINYEKCFLILLDNQDRKIHLSKNVLSFKEKLSMDIYKNIDQVEILQSSKAHNIFAERKSYDVIYPNIGDNLNYIMEIKSKYNLELNFLYDEKDLFCWQYSKKGFFNFKKSIPNLLTKFVL
tara:strand:+ start:96 stop:1235 length:1140 start_codon:yes stop_codon:yes gene_type:complete